MSYAQIKNNFTNFGLMTTGIWQPLDGSYADYTENCRLQIDASGIEKRQGYQTLISNVGGYGIIPYSYLDTDGTRVDEILLADTTLHRVKTGTLNIAYTGSAARAVCKVLVENGQFRLKLYENNILLLDRALGVGYEELTTETMADTSAAIHALADFNSTVTGTATIPAAFLEVTSELSIPKNTIKTIPFLYTEAVDSFLEFPLDGMNSMIGTDNSRNISWTTKRNIITIADGSYLKTYDGGALYRAGLPSISTFTLEAIGSGHLTGVYDYYYTYEFVDFQGNITESAFSEAKRISTNNEKVSFYIPNIRIDSGYNTKFAYANGSQTPSIVGDLATINVDTGFTLREGDYAYFINTHSDFNAARAYIIDSITSSSITVKTTENITIADNQVISNNLKINIYRSEESSTSRYLITSIPNDPFNSILYTDDAHFAVSGAGTFNVIAGTVSISVDSGHTLVAGDIITIPGIDGNLTVKSVGPTTVVVYHSSNITLAAGIVMYNTDLSYPVFTGDLTQRRDPPPEEVDYCTIYKGNLIAGKGAFLYWSDESQPLVSNSGYVFDLTVFDILSDNITGLGVSGDSFLVFTENSIEAYTSDDLSTGSIFKRNVSTSIGCVGGSAIASLGSRLWFLSRSGVGEILNGSLTVAGNTSQGNVISSNQLGTPLSSDISKYFNSYKDYELSRSVLSVDVQNNFLLVYLPIEENQGYSTRNSDLFIYDLSSNGWYLWKNFNVSGGIINSGPDLYFSGRHYGKTQRISFNKAMRGWDVNAYNDHADPVLQIYETKWDPLSAQTLNDQKLIDSLKVYSVKRRPEDYEFAPTLNATVYKDFENIVHSELEYTFPPQGTEWGFMWNNSPIGSWAAPYEKQDFEKETIETVKLRFSNNEESMNMKITGWAIKYINRPSMIKQ